LGTSHLEFRHRNDRKEHAARPDAEPVGAVDCGAPRPDRRAGRSFSGRSAPPAPRAHARRATARPSSSRRPGSGSRARHHHVAHIRGEADDLRRPSPAASKSTATKGASSTRMPTFSTGVTRKTCRPPASGSSKTAAPAVFGQSACLRRTTSRRAGSPCPDRRRTAGSKGAPAGVSRPSVRRAPRRSGCRRVRGSLRSSGRKRGRRSGAGGDAVGRARAADRSAGAGQDAAGGHAVDRDGARRQPHPVHAGPDARRHPRLRGAGDRGRRRARLPLHRRADLLPAADGRRDQPRQPADAVGAAAGDAGKR
jgi:hypothetical protein